MRTSRISYRISEILAVLITQVLLFAVSSTVIFGQSVTTARTDTRELHGGIEITPRVINVIALRLANGEEGYNVKILYTDSVTTSTPYPQDGKLTPEYISDIAQSVQKLSDKLQKEYKVPGDQIYVIALSDLAPQNPGDLVREVRNKTGKTVNILNAEAEVQLSIAGIIPRRYKTDNIWYENRNISSLIEIGNTSSKGGYQQLRFSTPGRPDYDYVTWSILKGASNFAVDVSRTVGETADYQAFAKQAEILSNNSFRGIIRAEVSRKPGMRTRKKVYLTGNIVWAMMSLLHPEDQRSYIPITMDDINTFYARAVADPESLLNPDLSKIRDEKLRNDLRRNRESVKQTFTPKTLIAGAELLRALSAELNLQEKSLIYPRFAYLARILSYVRLQPE